MKKVIIFIVIIVIFILAFAWKSKPKSNLVQTNTQSTAKSITQADKPQIVSTKPDPLDENIVSGDQAIEITFNRSLENVGEFKLRIEPKIEYKVELSGDRKTAKIIPAKPYPLGASFTLYINPDTKFDGVGNWGETKTFHFRTVKYSGV